MSALEAAEFARLALASALHLLWREQPFLLDAPAARPVCWLPDRAPSYDLGFGL